MRHHRLGHDEMAGRVDVEIEPPIGKVDLPDHLGVGPVRVAEPFRAEPRVVDQDVQAAEGRQAVGEDPFRVVRVGDITRSGDAFLADFGCGLVKHVTI